MYSEVYCKVVFDMCHVDRSIVTLCNALVWHVFDCTYLCTHCRRVRYAVEAELPAFVILNRTVNRLSAFSSPYLIHFSFGPRCRLLE